MSKPAAVRIDRLVDIPLDRDGLFLRAERRHWQDVTSCLHVAKWGTDEGGRKRPWWPLQYMQVPWELAPGVLDGLLAAAGVEIPYLVRAELGLLSDAEMITEQCPGWPQI